MGEKLKRTRAAAKPADAGVHGDAAFVQQIMRRIRNYSYRRYYRASPENLAIAIASAIVAEIDDPEKRGLTVANFESGFRQSIAAYLDALAQAKALREAELTAQK